MPKMTPSEAMAEVLVNEGVTHVGGIMGSAYMDLLDLFPAAGIDFISVRHEQTAGHMEDAYCRLTGKAGVVIGQNGPGVTNFVTAVATANMAHTPMVIISPSAGSVSIGWDGFQECDTWNLFKPITKASIRVPHPKRAGDIMRTAFRTAYAQRGPVLVDIPRDYFYGELEEEILKPHQYRVAPGGIGNPAQFAHAVEVIKNAKNLVIVAGRGVVDADCVKTVQEMAKFLGAPVATTYLHNDAYPCDDPFWTGPIGYMGSKAAMRILQKADVILAIGTRLSYFGTLPQYDINYFPKSAKIVQIDINPQHIAKPTRLKLVFALMLKTLPKNSSNVSKLLLKLKPMLNSNLFTTWLKLNLNNGTTKSTISLTNLLVHVTVKPLCTHVKHWKLSVNLYTTKTLSLLPISVTLLLLLTATSASKIQNATLLPLLSVTLVLLIKQLWVLNSLAQKIPFSQSQVTVLGV